MKDFPPSRIKVKSTGFYVLEEFGGNVSRAHLIILSLRMSLHQKNIWVLYEVL